MTNNLLIYKSIIVTKPIWTSGSSLMKCSHWRQGIFLENNEIVTTY